MSDDALIKEALAAGQKWIDNFRPDGKPNIPVIEAELRKRTHEGKPLRDVLVARCPKEATRMLKEWVEALTDPVEKEHSRKEIASCYEAVWDYYLMSFYESACGVLKGKDREFDGAEFIYQSLFPAFCAGLGYVINLGELLVGVCLPEAYRDEDGRIHREKGPAIVWGDDIEEYWWRGVQVPKEWIMTPESVDPKTGLTHEDIEQRRAFCEIVGWEKILELLNCKEVDVDDDPEVGVLLEVDLPDVGVERFLRVKCGTGRYFALPVPPDMETALQANAWTWGMEPDEYKPEVRT